MRTLADLMKERVPASRPSKIRFTDEQRKFVAEVFAHNEGLSGQAGRFGAVKMVAELRKHFGFKAGRTVFERLVADEFGKPWSGQ